MIFFLRLLLLALAISFPLSAQEVADDFEPAWWCRGGHAQTICGAVLRKTPEVAVTRKRIETPDGDFLDLDWVKAEKGKPLIIILPGLGSTSDASYIRTLMADAQKLGWQVAAVNARGATQPNRVVKTTHGGKSEDLNFLVRHIIENNISAEIYLVGYSLGGNIVLKWLGEKAEQVPAEVKKAVVVSVPFDLEKAAGNLDYGFQKAVYTRKMLGGLKEHALEKEKRFPGSLDVNKVKDADTFKVYDREVTARLNGFKDEIDYWTKSSSVHYLDSIHLPVLVIHAANDPFLPERDVPVEKIRPSAALSLLLTHDGGHLGFVSSRNKRWLEQKILRFFLEN